MCCDNKCLFFIKVRTGSLIFGYIAAVLSGIGVLVCIGLGFAIATRVMMFGRNDDLMAPLNLVEIFFMELTAGFTCTVLLLYGITENKAALVKTYVIYGMIHLVLLLVGVIIIFCVTIPILGVVGLFGCVMYTLCIYMVYLTHKGMVTEAESRSFSNPPNLLLA